MTAGWILSVIAIATCNFVSVDGDNEAGAFTGMGLYWFESRFSQCFFLDFDGVGGNVPYWVGTKMNAARITSALSSFWAFCVMWLMWMGVCCGCFHGNCMRKTVGIMSMGICALMGGIFAVFSSSSCNSGCSMAMGAYCAVFSMLSYFICGIICCCIPHSKHDNDDIAQQGPPAAPAAAAATAPAGDTVAVEKTVNADGSTVTKTTTTHPDGSKTVEEVVEAPLIAATVGDEKV
mmetsp:Transcript_27446/g.60148  ORF Transcript_27446/g.60148 Transcript_27446/m.60148 type:complete len:234 (+) Transcript_27446:232-933(+)